MSGSSNSKVTAVLMLSVTQEGKADADDLDMYKLMPASNYTYTGLYLPELYLT